jgi:hypothetical protein
MTPRLNIYGQVYIDDALARRQAQATRPLACLHFSLSDICIEFNPSKCCFSRGSAVGRGRRLGARSRRAIHDPPDPVNRNADRNYCWWDEGWEPEDIKKSHHKGSRRRALLAQCVRLDEPFAAVRIRVDVHISPRVGWPALDAFRCDLRGRPRKLGLTTFYLPPSREVDGCCQSLRLAAACVGANGMIEDTLRPKVIRALDRRAPAGHQLL